jgi:hypothetical protein
MPKRFQHTDGPPYTLGRHASWSIGANGLTAAGQNELLKQIGRQLQTNYQDVLKEPAPDRIRELLNRLEARSSNGHDEEDL